MAAEDSSPNLNDLSFFSQTYNLPSINENLAQWDRAWEKTLLTLSASEVVYPTVCAIWKRIRLESVSYSQYDTALELQKALVDLEKKCETLYFDAVWKLVDEHQRKKHLLNGMKEACESSAFYQDSRAMCPEITTTAMLDGMAFIDFTRDLCKAIKEHGTENVYMLPSDWWQSAVDLPQPWSEDDLFTFTQLSAIRNEFIGDHALSHTLCECGNIVLFLVRFVYYSIHSVLQDIVEGAPEMKNVVKHIATEKRVAISDAKVMASVRDKPLIRCENCTKTQGENAEDLAFMLCSRCKSNLDFTVHYCSKACQKADWRNHKNHCGKEKVAKSLTGSIHDVFWRYPTIPDIVRPIGPTPDGEQFPVESLGFGAPHPSRPHSLALQRQASLLEADKDAEYFLFDEADVPIRFVIDDMRSKLMFRAVRTLAMFGAEPQHVDLMADHLIKKAGPGSALSPARILEQLTREYEVDMEAKVMAVEARLVEEGYDPASSYLETMANVPVRC